MWLSPASVCFVIDAQSSVWTLLQHAGMSKRTSCIPQGRALPGSFGRQSQLQGRTSQQASQVGGRARR